MAIRILAAGTLFAAKILPNSIFLDKYRKFRATYGFDGNELPISKQVSQRIEDVMNDLKVPEDVRDKIKFFHVHDIKMFHAGTVNGFYGAIIGIPPNFNYESSNLPLDQVGVHNKSALWTDEISQNFIDCLVLSEDAQKFAIAREVKKVIKLNFWMKLFNLALDTSTVIVVHETFYVFLKMINRPAAIQILYGCACILGGFILWLVLENAIDKANDEEIAEELTKLGPKYVQGGKEFYEKLCEQNHIINHFVSNFNPLVRYQLRKTEKPPSEQKEFFTLKLQELESDIM